MRFTLGWALIACVYAASVGAQQSQTVQASPGDPAGQTPSAGTAASGPSTVSLQAIIVTGTRLQVPNANSPAPITILGASDLLNQGTSKVEDLLNGLPQVNATLTDAANGSSAAPLTGTATVDLRGIGAWRTLVLINGRRANPGEPLNPSVDLHSIPEILVQRVEVLTGGASSIYGSDAEAGVVNFVIDHHFTGTKFVAQGSGFFASNDNAGIQSIVRASGVNPATGSVFDGRTINITGVHGGDFAAQAGHVEVYAGYRHNAAILGSSRDTSSCVLQEAASSYSCLLDGTTPNGQFVPYDATGTTPGNSYTLGADGKSLRPFNPVSDGYNPAPPETLLRPDTRYIAGVFAQYRFGNHAESYLEGEFMNDNTSVQYPPSGTTATGAGLNTYAVPCNDPLLSPNEIKTICTDNGLSATDVATVGIGRRNVEAGLLHEAYRHSSTRVVLGVKGAINDAWTFDLSGQFGRVTSHHHLWNDVSASRLANALDVVSVNGTPTCLSVVNGTDPSCVPYDIWESGGVTPAAVSYVTQTRTMNGHITQTIFDAQATGDLGQYGLKSPMASEPVRVAVGAEYRRVAEQTTYQPDQPYIADLITLSGVRRVHGSFHVAEVFGEVRVPLLENLPFASSMNLDISDRFAHYSPQGPANSYNLGVDWAPVRPVRFRASYSRAIRAPNAYELFFPQNVALQQLADPCSGPIPTASSAQCALTGVTSAQYGHIPLASSVAVVSGGNPHLKPERAATLTAGVVFTHFDWAPSLLVSVDYWRIRVNGYVGQVPATTSLTSCMASGNPVFCGLIARGPGGSLTGNLASGYILQADTNTGGFGESGVDVAGQYVLKLGMAGRIDFTFNGSALVDNPINVNPATPLVDCTGLYGPSCTGEGPTSPVPKWRHSLRSTWSRGGYEVSLNWRHIGAMKFEGRSAYFNGESVYPVDDHVSAYDYFDLEAGRFFGDGVDLRLGVNNLFGKKPPIIGYNSSPLLINGNMLSGIYDTLGRELFVEASVRF